MTASVLVLIGQPGADLPTSSRDGRVIDVLDRANGGKVAIVAFNLGVESDGYCGRNPPAHLTPWSIPGLRAAPGPFRWLWGYGPDGTRSVCEVSHKVDFLPERLSIPGFRGLVRPWEELPTETEHRDLVCAVLICSRLWPPELFVDLRARCNHAHLANDVTKLVDAYERNHLDRGWTRWPNGDACTGITTRRVIEEADVDPKSWAQAALRSEIMGTMDHVPRTDGEILRVLSEAIREFGDVSRLPIVLPEWPPCPQRPTVETPHATGNYADELDDFVGAVDKYRLAGEDIWAAAGTLPPIACEVKKAMADSLRERDAVLSDYAQELRDQVAAIRSSIAP